MLHVTDNHSPCIFLSLQRCGFLGLLHLDVFRQRLTSEYGAETGPGVGFAGIEREGLDKSKTRQQNSTTLESKPINVYDVKFVVPLCTKYVHTDTRVEATHTHTYPHLHFCILLCLLLFLLLVPFLVLLLVVLFTLFLCARGGCDCN